MKVIIAGTRTFDSWDIFDRAIEQAGFKITEVFCGCATGVDSFGERFAKANNIPIKYFPADWERFGRAGGPIRNAEMAAEAEALILIWDGKSPGSRNILKNAKQRGLKIYQYIYGRS